MYQFWQTDTEYFVLEERKIFDDILLTWFLLHHLQQS